MTVSASFFWSLNSFPFYAYTTIFCFYSSISWGHLLPLFGYLEIMLLWALLYKFLCRHKFSVSWGRRVALQSHRVTVCFKFWRTTKLSSKAAIPFYIPTSDVWSFQFLYILTRTNSHGYKVLSSWLLMLSIFSCASFEVFT